VKGIDMNEEKFISQLKSQFDGETLEYADVTSLVISAKYLIAAVDKIRMMGFERLSDITAVDYYPGESPRFHVVYLFTSLANRATLCLRVPIPGVNPAVPSIEKIYPNANWRERELFDMFGIDFPGHSDLRRILMPHDWEGHPLRKDYPLGYEEPQFTFNFDEIDVRKPYAKE
jgi:NADH-quinone oxidoreductase subunit C